MHLFLACVHLLGTAVSADQPPAKPKEQMRVMPVAKTPEPTTVVLTIALPKDGQVVNGNPVWVQFRIDGYSLGAASPFDRADELVESKMGQTVHVVVDNLPYFPVNEPAITPFDEDGYYYDMSYKFELPEKLKEGMHTLRVFPARSFGESLKGEKTFHATFFYLGAEKPSSGMDLSAPFLTYNEPSDQMYLFADKPVLLDFYLSNCDLSPDGYKVRLTVDGTMTRVISSWQPYYISGLKKGTHTIRLELIDEKNLLVPGIFNDNQRTITIH